MVSPVLYIYGSHHGLRGMEHYPITRFSMGNLGFADTLCYNQLNQFEYLKKINKHSADKHYYVDKEVRCRTGVLAPKIIFSGLLPDKNLTNKTDTSKQVFHDFCGDISEIEPADTCPNDFYAVALDSYYEKYCAGKSSCTIDLTPFIN